MEEFLEPQPGSWTQRLVDDIIRPAQERVDRHPFFEELAAGTLPVEKMVRWSADMLWITVGFGGWMAAVGSHCPVHDHAIKEIVIRNALEESTHPPMLAKFLRAAGYECDHLLNGPMHAHRPTRHAENVVDFLNSYSYHASFVEGISAIGSMESMTPRQCALIHAALRDQYGFSDDELEWTAVHAGEIEQSHAQAALMIVERYTEGNDDLRGRCEYAVQRGVHLAGSFPDVYYEAEGDVGLERLPEPVRV